MQQLTWSSWTTIFPSKNLKLFDRQSPGDCPSCGGRLIGLSIPEYRDLFLRLTPLQLLSSLFLILAFHRGWSEVFSPIFAAAAFWIGFGVWADRIHTGLSLRKTMFNGPTLGPKLWEVPNHYRCELGLFLVLPAQGRYFTKSPHNDYYGCATGGLRLMTAIDYSWSRLAVALEYVVLEFERLFRGVIMPDFGFIMRLFDSQIDFQKGKLWQRQFNRKSSFDLHESCFSQFF